MARHHGRETRGISDPDHGSLAEALLNRVGSAIAGDVTTPGAPVGESVQGGAEVNVELVGQRGRPSYKVAEFVFLLLDGPLAHGLRELTKFLGEPGDGGRHSSFGIDTSIGSMHQFLELSDVHVTFLPAIGSPRFRVWTSWRRGSTKP